jgi:hypothetical protein
MVLPSIFFYLMGWDLTPLGPFAGPLGSLSPSTAATLAYCTLSPDDTWGWLWSNWWSERRLQGKPKYSEKTCPAPLCPTTNPRGLLTWRPFLSDRMPAYDNSTQRLTCYIDILKIWRGDFSRSRQTVRYCHPYFPIRKHDLHKAVNGFLHISHELFCR